MYVFTLPPWAFRGFRGFRGLLRALRGFLLVSSSGFRFAAERPTVKGSCSFGLFAKRLNKGSPDEEGSVFLRLITGAMGTFIMSMDNGLLGGIRAGNKNGEDTNPQRKAVILAMTPLSLFKSSTHCGFFKSFLSLLDNRACAFVPRCAPSRASAARTSCSGCWRGTR